MLFISEGQRACNKRIGLWLHAGHLIYGAELKESSVLIKVENRLWIESGTATK